MGQERKRENAQAHSTENQIYLVRDLRERLNMDYDKWFLYMLPWHDKIVILADNDRWAAE